VYCTFLCVILVIVPAKLIEFRYFIVPFLLLRMHMDNVPSENELKDTPKWLVIPPKIALALEYTIYIMTNVFTFYMFLQKPFQWPSGEEARFMW